MITVCGNIKRLLCEQHTFCVRNEHTQIEEKLLLSENRISIMYRTIVAATICHNKQHRYRSVMKENG
jgi:hypothetical protein